MTQQLDKADLQALNRFLAVAVVRRVDWVLLFEETIAEPDTDFESIGLTPKAIVFLEETSPDVDLSDLASKITATTT